MNGPGRPAGARAADDVRDEAGRRGPPGARAADDDGGVLRLAVGLGGSVVFHVALVVLLVSGVFEISARAPTPREDRVVHFEVVEMPPAPEPVAEAVPPAPEPPPPNETPPPPPPPQPPIETPPPPPPPAAVPDAPPTDVPPPPSNDPDAAPPEPGAEPVPLRPGISMRSTVGEGQGSGMRVGVGNTLYGRPDDVAADPRETRGYQGGEVPTGDRVEPPGYVPPHRVSTPPRVRREVRIPYPPEAQREGIEGRVVLRLRIDATGRVLEVEVLEGPGYGLDEAAAEALRSFRFRPAMVDGEAVATDLRYVYTFLLD